MEKTTIEISWISLWRVLFFLVLVTIVFLGRQVILGLFLAVVISSGLEFMVNFLEKRGLPRTLGVVFVFLASILTVIIVVYAVIPILIVDLNDAFGKSFLGSSLGSLIDFRTSRSVNSFVSSVTSRFFSGNISPLRALADVLGGLGLAIGVLVSSFYLSLSRDGVERFIKAVFPDDYEPIALRIYSRSFRKIGSWFRVQIFLSLAMGALSWLAFTILGLKSAFLLGVLAAIFELVPFVGPILSGAAAVVVAFTISFNLAIYVAIASLVLHQLESHFFVPLLAKRVVDVHPVIVIAALLIGAQVEGVLGLVIAVPAAVVFQDLIEEWSSRKRNSRE